MATEPLTPTAAFQYVLNRTPMPSMLCSLRKKPGRPGELIAKMPVFVREALRELEAARLPTPTRDFLRYVCCESNAERAREAEYRQLLSELKLAFDKNILRV